VTTDRSGQFEIPGANNDTVTVDPLSLSRGWILGATRRNGGRYEIAVLAVAPVEVELAIARTDSLGRLDSVDLSRAIVLARHESGKVWVSRKAGPTRAVFDALPTGRYTVEVDVADLKEPLEMQNRPAFEVDGASAIRTPTVKVTLRPRPVTIRRLDEVRP
jgi:hypothetical protein